MGKIITKRSSQALYKGPSGIPELTPKQRTFVQTMVRHGCTPVHAAKLAGYASYKSASFELMRLPHVMAAIRSERERYICGELANVATGTLQAILTDDKAPAAARVQAARTVLELSGDLRKAKEGGQDADRPLSELSAEELTAMIDRWTAEKAALARDITDQVEVLDPAPGLDKAQAMAGLQPETQ